MSAASGASTPTRRSAALSIVTETGVRPRSCAPTTARVDGQRDQGLVPFLGPSAYIEPIAVQNPYVESFGSRIRDELLAVEQFSCLPGAGDVATAETTTSAARTRRFQYAPPSSPGMLSVKRQGDPLHQPRKALRSLESGSFSTPVKTVHRQYSHAPPPCCARPTAPPQAPPHSHKHSHHSHTSMTPQHPAPLAAISAPRPRRGRDTDGLCRRRISKQCSGCSTP